jgi:hypothetical protein
VLWEQQSSTMKAPIAFGEHLPTTTLFPSSDRVRIIVVTFSKGRLVLTSSSLLISPAHTSFEFLVATSNSPGTPIAWCKMLPFNPHSCLHSATDAGD